MPFFKGEEKQEDALCDMQAGRDVDVLFVKKFNDQGGKFLYCEHFDNIPIYLKNIVNEGGYSMFWCADPSLQTYLKHLGLNFNDVPDPASVNFMRCEYLIARDGSVMLSSDQTDGRRLLEFSNTFIILAVANQIVSNVDEALHKVKLFKEDRIPTNITTIKSYDPSCFQSPSQRKNIYLLLLEYDKD